MRVGAGEYTDGELGGRNSIKSVVNERPRKNRRPLFSFQFVESESEGTFGPTKTIRLEGTGLRPTKSNACPLYHHLTELLFSYF